MCASEDIALMLCDIGKLPKESGWSRIYLGLNPRLQQLQPLTTKCPLAQLNTHFQRLPQAHSYLLETDSCGAIGNAGYYMCHTAGYYQYLKLELRDITEASLKFRMR